MREKLLLASLGAGVLAVVVVVLMQTVGAEHELIQRAIAAHGGDAALGRIKSGRVRGSEVRQSYYGPQSSTWEETFELPDRLRFLLQTQKPAGARLYLSEPKQWFQRRDNEPFQPAESAAPAELYLQPLLQLVAIRAQGLPLTLVEDEEIAFRPASGVLVESPEWGKVLFYFDQASGLLVKLKKEPEEPQGVRVEKVFSQHQRFGDLLLPTRVTEYILGDKKRELTVNQVEIPATVDPEAFAKP